MVQLISNRLPSTSILLLQGCSLLLLQSVDSQDFQTFPNFTGSIVLSYSQWSQLKPALANGYGAEIDEFQDRYHSGFISNGGDLNNRFFPSIRNGIVILWAGLSYPNNNNFGSSHTLSSSLVLHDCITMYILCCQQCCICVHDFTDNNNHHQW